MKRTNLLVMSLALLALGACKPDTVKVLEGLNSTASSQLNGDDRPWDCRRITANTDKNRALVQKRFDATP